MSLNYDDLFLREVAGGDHEKAKDTVIRIIEKARPMFQWASLGSKVLLEVLETKYVGNELALCNTAGCDTNRLVNGIRLLEDIFKYLNYVRKRKRKTRI